MLLFFFFLLYRNSPAPEIFRIQLGGWLVLGMLGVHFDGYSDSMPSRRGVFGVVVVVAAGKIDRELQVPGGTGTNRGRGLCS